MLRVTLEDPDVIKHLALISESLDEHKNLTSTEESCFLTETGLQPKFHKIYFVATCAPLIFCLAKKFAE